MFCKECGRELPQGAKFCKSCGAPVAQENMPEKGAEGRQQHQVQHNAPAEPTGMRSKAPVVALCVLLIIALFVGGFCIGMRRTDNGGKAATASLQTDAADDSQNEELVQNGESNSELVSDAYSHDCSYVCDAYNSLTDQVEEQEVSISFHIPKVNLESDDTTKANHEIYNTWYPQIIATISEINEYGEPMTSGGMDYSWAVNGDKLSLIVRSYSCPNDGCDTTYYSYNFTVSKGEILAANDVYASAGYSQSKYCETVKNAMGSAYYDWNNTYITQYGYDPYFYTQLEETISEENVANTSPFFDEEGQLCIIATVYSLTDAEYFQEIIGLDEFQINEDYLAYSSLDAEEKESLLTSNTSNSSIFAVINSITGDWTDGITEYQFFADATYVLNTIFFRNEEIASCVNIEAGIVEVTGTTSANLAPYVEDGSIQNWSKLVYSAEYDTIFVGSSTHAYYRLEDWLSGNAPEVTLTESEPIAENTYGDNIAWTLNDGVLEANGEGKMVDYTAARYVPWYDIRTKVTSAVITGNITNIGNYAFDSFSKLTDISLPDTIRSIGECAFWECYNLESINMPENLVCIYRSAFYNCTSLTELDLPDGLQSIEYNAFCGCSGLKSVSIPATVTEIALGAFDKCDSLSDVYYSGTNGQWESIEIGSRNDDLVNATVHFNT